MTHIIGIDLGTTNSVVAFLESTRLNVIPNAEGSKTTPSVVLYRSVDEVIVGELAKRQLVINPSSTISSIKRLIGNRFGEIGDVLKQIHYNVIDDPQHDSVLVDLGWGRVSPEEVSAEILKKMRQSAESYLNETIDRAVVTVPAHFNDSQRSATKYAAELAGLEVVRIINEPTAAALAYGLNKEKSEKVAVFDFGGGTFDISILELDGNLFEVRSTNGNTFLGGDNIDHCLFEFVRQELKKETNIDPVENLQAVQRVYEAVEKVKCELSTLTSTTISLPFIVSDDAGPKHFNRDITREEFNRLASPTFEELLPPCRNALMDAGLTPPDIDTILLVGGSTRIPKVREMVSEFFGKEPLQVINPDEVVAMGAAIQGGVIDGSLKEVLLLDVTPLSLGIELANDLFSVLIARNSNVPTTASKRFTTVVDNQSIALIHVLQGERKIASENRSLAHFRLIGIAPAPREVPEIEVRFIIDANGILNVSATDLSSGAREAIRVESYQGSLGEDYEKVIHEAKAKSGEDSLFIEKVRRKEKSERNLDIFKRFLTGEEEHLEPEDVKSIEELITDFEKAIKAYNYDEAEQWAKTLSAMAEKYGTRFYKYRVGKKEKK